MSHDPFVAGQRITAADLNNLDNQGTYTPVLTAVTTNPNLGSTGTALGFWQRNGHLITGWARFTFGGTGISAGSGIYRVSLPFTADLAIVEDGSGAAAGFGSPVGYASSRDDSAVGNSRAGIPMISGSGTAVYIQQTDTVARFSDAAPFVWATGDRLSVTFHYPMDL